MKFEYKNPATQWRGIGGLVKGAPFLYEKAWYVKFIKILCLFSGKPAEKINKMLILFQLMRRRRLSWRACSAPVVTR